jgi:hypothetical protein
MHDHAKLKAIVRMCGSKPMNAVTREWFFNADLPIFVAWGDWMAC